MPGKRLAAAFLSLLSTRGWHRWNSGQMVQSFEGRNTGVGLAGHILDTVPRQEEYQRRFMELCDQELYRRIRSRRRFGHVDF